MTAEQDVRVTWNNSYSGALLKLYLALTRVDGTYTIVESMDRKLNVWTHPPTLISTTVGGNIHITDIFLNLIGQNSCQISHSEVCFSD